MVFKKYDQSGDGYIDFKEFGLIFTQKDWSGEANTDQINAKAMMKDDPYLHEKNRQAMEAASLRHDSPQSLLKLFKDKLRARGARGMIGLQRIFKIMDDDESGTLSLREFTKACKDFRIGISDENVPALFALFDSNGDGTMSYDEFMHQVRGQLSGPRADVVKKAFDVIDENANGLLDIDELKGRFDASRHPSVLNGDTTELLLTNEFFETFEAHHKMVNSDQRYVPVNLAQFGDYYTSVSSLYENDEDFIQMMVATWKLKGPSAAMQRQREKQNQPPATFVEAKRYQDQDYIDPGKAP